MKKRVLALAAAGLMAVSIFAGCGGSGGAAAQSAASSTQKEASSGEKESSGEKASSEEKAAPEAVTGSFSVGFLDQAAEVPPVIRMREIIRSVVETAGGELICEACSENAGDVEVNAVEKLIAAGVSGIIMTPSSDAILPTVISMCEENGVYLAITFRNIGDEEVKEIVEASPYYAGNCYEDEEVAGYKVMSNAFAKRDDIEKVALIALAVGDNTSDARVAGIQAACEENGAEIVAEVRDIMQPSDAKDAVANFVAAYPDLDCIVVASCYDNASITALPEAVKATGKTPEELCIVSCDGGSDLTALFDYGYTISVGGGHLEIDRGSTAVMLVNAIQGNPLGSPAHIAIPYMYFGSVEDVADYAIYVEGDVPIWTPEEIADDLLISTNPELTPEDVIGMIQGYSLEDLKARHKDIVEG